MNAATGMTQVYTPQHDAAFTPRQTLYGAAMSPSSPGYGGGGMGGESARYSPHPGMASPGGMMPGATPIHGYGTSPAYANSGYGDAAGIGGYSPAPSSRSPYSPTGVMGAYSQSPSYSPTAPNANYGQSMNPIQHQSNHYQYGTNTASQPAYSLPNVRSPSQSPANRSSSPGGGTSG